jgi:lysophospholipase L1-like esterase
MREVHAGFNGQKGYAAQFGDSITYSMAFWSPMSWDDPSKYLSADDVLPKAPGAGAWKNIIKGARDKGPKFANYSGWKVGDLLKSVDAVLARDKPETAIIMIGTNDISGGKVPENYRAGLVQVIAKCLAAHCVPILNTIPPRRDREKAVDAINTIIREVAKEKRIPLADFHAACLRVRPGTTWDGTIISEDGVHPSGGKTNVYDKANLKTSGYALRNWVNFLVFRQLYFGVYEKR